MAACLANYGPAAQIYCTVLNCLRSQLWGSGRDCIWKCLFPFSPQDTPPYPDRSSTFVFSDS